MTGQNLAATGLGGSTAAGLVQIQVWASTEQSYSGLR